MKIKVCGITREEDIAELLLAGVDFIGFNFIKSSPRYTDINWAVNIINKYNIQKKAVPLCEISDLKTIHHKLKNLDFKKPVIGRNFSKSKFDNFKTFI